MSSTTPTTSLPTSLTTPPTSGQSFTQKENEPELADSASKDPIFYQNLLPKPGSTDNTWETLMEVQKASETVKLQQLVDNIDHKMNDPNQCIICQRVLSCKSALQMHYRTHTGERPFKCKICCRAFTTKGNLKTHMGVHRVKPPLRMLHQCPICHKQFTNALVSSCSFLVTQTWLTNRFQVLQQHLRMHAGEQGNSFLRDFSPDMLSKLKNNPLLPSHFPQAFLSSFPGPFSMPPGAPNLFSHALLPELSAQQSNDMSSDADTDIPEALDVSTDKLEQFNADEFPKREQPIHDDKTESIKLRSGDAKRKLFEDSYEDDFNSKADEDRSVSDTTEVEEPLESTNKKKKLALDFTSASIGEAGDQNDKDEPNEETQVKEENSSLTALESHVMNSTAQISPKSTSLFATSLRTSQDRSMIDITTKSTSCDSHGSSKSSPSMYGGNPPFAGLPYHPTGRPNTTCRICLKTFACYSALEIHYRSHTKERPYKCEVCDRGFSTKGNMKQHMLTHKIRDLPPDLYTTVSPSSNTTLGNFLTSSHVAKLMGRHYASNDNSTTNSNNSSRVSSPPTPNGTNSNHSVDFASEKLATPESPSGDQSSTSSRTSGSNKHMCNMCNKPFSSGSALQVSTLWNRDG